MNIRIPAWVMSAWDAFRGWANVPIIIVWYFEIVRIDVLLAIGLAGGVGYYWMAGGWLLGLKAGVLFGFFVLVGLQLRGRLEESEEDKEV